MTLLPVERSMMNPITLMMLKMAYGIARDRYLSESQLPRGMVTMANE